MSRKKGPPERIGAIVEEVLSGRGYLAFCREYEAVTRWPEIVGEKVAAVTCCTAVEDGVLKVKVSGAAWRHELLYVKTDILSKVKRCSSTIRDIVFY